MPLTAQVSRARDLPTSIARAFSLQGRDASSAWPDPPRKDLLEGPPHHSPRESFRNFFSFSFPFFCFCFCFFFFRFFCGGDNFCRRKICAWRIHSACARTAHATGAIAMDLGRTAGYAVSDLPPLRASFRGRARGVGRGGGAARALRRRVASRSGGAACSLRAVVPWSLLCLICTPVASGL